MEVSPWKEETGTLNLIFLKPMRNFARFAKYSYAFDTNSLQDKNMTKSGPKIQEPQPDVAWFVSSASPWVYNYSDITPQEPWNKTFNANSHDTNVGDSQWQSFISNDTTTIQFFESDRQNVLAIWHFSRAMTSQLPYHFLTPWFAFCMIVCMQMTSLLCPVQSNLEEWHRKNLDIMLFVPSRLLG